MRVLGLDLGARRIGVALSDPEGRLAFPAEPLHRRGRGRDLTAIAAIVAERGVERVVVGLPLHMDGRAGEAAQEARAFARELAERCGVPVETLDERWTTMEAERALVAGGGSARSRARARKSGAVDSMAATLILRTYLERCATRARAAQEPAR